MGGSFLNARGRTASASLLLALQWAAYFWGGAAQMRASQGTSLNPQSLSWRAHFIFCFSLPHPFWNNVTCNNITQLLKGVERSTIQRHLHFKDTVDACLQNERSRVYFLMRLSEANNTSPSPAAAAAAAQVVLL
eukprot:57333-Pelagomonas_calceolata.AAC.2